MKNSSEKIIKDLVHDYITLDSFFQKLVDTKHFQRLRFIKQLTCQYVYPSANHTRFEHSLGVYYLSRRYLRVLKKKLISLGVKEEKYDFILFNLSIASLLHDVGHAPLSHLGEIYFNAKEIKESLNPECTKLNIDKSIFESHGSYHEIMSCYIILKYFDELIIKENTSSCRIDFELICRMIIGARYNSDDKWVENIAIDALNSNTIDMDKLDYIIRDSFMTGISVPAIDVSRFFRGLDIENKKVVIKKQAITVVQNIIDARDCLYLLVYNHHIAVYTDFVFEFYIKHLILLEEDIKNEKTDKLRPYDYFSCNAIGEKLVTDNDLMEKLKEYFINQHNVSDYTLKLTPQIFERKFLKPLWKNLYEFKLFLTNEIQNDNVINELIEKLCDSKDYLYRSYIATEIIERLHLRNGDIFIVPRSNKFYINNKNNKFYITVDGNLKDISNLLPQKKYNDLYSNVAFYVFGPSSMIEEIKKEFINIVKNGLPPRDKIDRKSSKPKWLTNE